MEEIVEYESALTLFSSPFIEERLYLKLQKSMALSITLVLVPFYRGAVVFFGLPGIGKTDLIVLVPFYRGAVVFHIEMARELLKEVCSRPLLSRSGCI